MYIGELFKFKDKKIKTKYILFNTDDEKYYFRPVDEINANINVFSLPKKGYFDYDYEMSLFKKDMYSVESRKNKLKRILCL